MVYWIVYMSCRPKIPGLILHSSCLSIETLVNEQIIRLICSYVVLTYLKFRYFQGGAQNSHHKLMKYGTIK